MPINYQSIGTTAYSAAAGATSLAVPYPTPIAQDDMLVIVVAMKPGTANSGSVATPAGWTAVPNGSLVGAGGYGTTLGADTGNTNVFSFYRVATGSESGNVTLSLTNANVAWANIQRYSNATKLWSVAGGTGQDTTAGNVSIATTTTIALRPGDELIGAMVIPTDVTTPAQFSAIAFTATGVTFGAVTELTEPDTTQGNDLGGFLCYGEVATGTTTVAVTMTATAGGTTTNVRGPGLLIRLREEIGAVQALRTSNVANTSVFGTATVQRLGPKQNLQSTGYTNVTSFGAGTIFAQFLRYIGASAITYGGVSAQNSPIDLNVVLPSTVQALDLIVFVVGYKPNIDPQVPGTQFPIVSVSEGFSIRGSMGFGITGVATGPDVGSMGYDVLLKSAQAGDAGRTIVVTTEVTSASWVQALVYRATDSTHIRVAVDDFNQDTSPGSTITAIFGTQSPYEHVKSLSDDFDPPGIGIYSTYFNEGAPLRRGDELVFFMAIPTDATTPAQFSGYTFTPAGAATIGPIAELSEPDSALGDDIGGFVARASVGGGVGSCAGTFAFNVAGTTTNVVGPVVQVRLSATCVAQMARYDDPDEFGTLSLATVGPVAQPERAAFFAVF